MNMGHSRSEERIAVDLSMPVSVRVDYVRITLTLSLEPSEGNKEETAWKGHRLDGISSELDLKGRAYAP